MYVYSTGQWKGMCGRKPTWIEATMHTHVWVENVEKKKYPEDGLHFHNIQKQEEV